MNNRFLRPVCMVLTVLYALSGVYIVMKRVLVALVDRFAAESAVLFVQGSSVVDSFSLLSASELACFVWRSSPVDGCVQLFSF